MQFQVRTKCSGLPNSSSWKVERECRRMACVRVFTNRPFKNFWLSSAYGFGKTAIIFVYNYLSSRKQRSKTSDIYSSWREILYGLPQGLILGPLLFNIDICYLFFIIEHFDIPNYADDNTPYLSGKMLKKFWIVHKICCQTFYGLKGNETNVIY